MPAALTLLLDVAALLVSKATFIGLRLLTLYWCASLSGSIEFGTLSLAFTVAEICRFVGDWGCDTLALRRFSRPDLGEAQQQLWQLLPLRVMSSLVAGTLALLIITQVVQTAVPMHGWLIAATAVSSLWLNLGVNWLQARGELKSGAALLAVMALGTAAVLLHILRGQSSISQLLMVLIGSELLMAACLLALIARRQRLRFVLNHSQLLDWLRQATPIALAAFIALAYGRFDFFFIKAQAPGQALGDYALANRMTEPCLFIAAALASTLYARAASRALVGDAGLQDMAWIWVRRVVSVAAVLGLLLFVVLPQFLAFRFPDYHQAPLFARFAALTLAFRCINLCLTAFIQATGAYGQMLRLSVFNMFLIALLVFALGGLWSAVGAAAAVAVGEMVNTVRQWRVLGRQLKLSPATFSSQPP